MNEANFIILCIACLLTFPLECCGTKDEFLKQLSQLRVKEQFTESLPFRGIGQWQQLEGLYKNYVLFNLRGKCQQSQARVNNKIPDVQSFISPFVAMQLFDSYRFGHAPMASQAEIERTVRLVGKFHDRNQINTSSITFYPQYYDDSSSLWYTTPENIANALQTPSSANSPPVSTVLLGPAPLPDGFENFFTARAMVLRFTIPPDFDSSSVNLCFGSLLYELRDSYPDAWQMWFDDNRNLESLIAPVKKYAYRPFSDDVIRNRIDPRSYYFMRPFLDQAKRDGKDLAILPVWMENQEDAMRLYKAGLTEHFGTPINSIDVTVHANFLTGMYNAFSSGLISVQTLSDDSDLELIIDSTASLLVYMLETNMTNRYDLAMLFYTSEIQFYWFAARGLMHMENDKLKGKTFLPVFEKYYDGLKAAMTTKITDRILSLKQEDSNGGVFYDDLLGAADVSYYNRPINRAEDRLFTTAMAANSLMYIWSVYDESRQQLVWRDSVPEPVKETVRGCAQWLEANSLSGQYLPLNSFFTIDFKNRESMMYFYPANRFQFWNGTEVYDRSRLPSEQTLYVMEGYVEPDEYDRLLKLDKFGVPTPLTFPGFNQLQGATIVWSSDALTYSGVMMTVAMNDVLDV